MSHSSSSPEAPVSLHLHGLQHQVDQRQPAIGLHHRDGAMFELHHGGIEVASSPIWSVVPMLNFLPCSVTTS